MPTTETAFCQGGAQCHHDPMCTRPRTLQDLLDAQPVMGDMVNNPKHYELEPGLDAMYVIRLVLGEEGWKAYCKGNMLKYLLRKKWDADEDIAKTGRYADMYKGVTKEGK